MKALPATTDSLLKAWSRELPGKQQHPGPAANQWKPTAAEPHANPWEKTIASIFGDVWWSGSFHPSPLTGKPTSIRQRPIPSAGACYPIQTHVLCAGQAGAPPSRYFYDHTANTLIRVGETNLARGTLIVLTVLPQRTAAKYHHRAWPLWIADTAYALTTIAAASKPYGLHPMWLGPKTPQFLADLIGLPSYGDWLQFLPNSQPELATAALYLSPQNPADPVPTAGVTSTLRFPPTANPEADVRSTTGSEPIQAFSDAARDAAVPSQHLNTRSISREALTRRRSKPFASMQRPAGTTAAPQWITQITALAQLLTREPLPPGCHIHILDSTQDPALAEAADRSSGQKWLHHADLIILFTGPSSTKAEHLISSLWWATITAAEILHATLEGPLRADTRPIAGWTDPATPGKERIPGRILHGLALWEADQ